MCKSLLLCGAAAIMALPAAADVSGHPVKSLSRIFTPKKTVLSPIKAHHAPTRAADGKWLASKESMSMWEGQWIHVEDNDLTFDKNGNVVTQLTSEIEDEETVGYTRTSNTYNDNGMVTLRLVESSLNGKDFTLSEQREVAYDPILTNVIISNVQTMWYGDENYPGNCYHFDITRNDDGNITLAERAVLFDGAYDPTERFSLEYGQNGTPTTLIESKLNYNYDTGEYYWTVEDALSDVTWVETDGQVYSLDAAFSGNNKMKSAIFVDDETGMTMQINVEYPAEGGLVMKMSIDEVPGMTASLVYTPLPNGGHHMVTSEEYEGTVIFSEESIIEYSANGFILREYSREEEFGDDPYIEETKGVFFGTDEEKPEAYEYSYFDPESEEWIPGMRVEFSDYTFVETSGIDITTDSEAPAEYYNLQGVRIQSPVKGTVCIERRGSSARKVLVK